MSTSCKFSFINFKQFVLKERFFLYANNDNHKTIIKNKPILMFEKKYKNITYLMMHPIHSCLYCFATHCFDGYSFLLCNRLNKTYCIKYITSNVFKAHINK